MTDGLGTPRMVVDKTGSPASVKRHDYLPFGEEIGGPQVALIGGRTTAQGYVADGTRQKFTGYEADGETGLNFAEARYQSSAQGRFTSVDPLGASATVLNPQSFNRYSYVNNNPTNLTDPSGMMTPNPETGMVQTDDESYARTLQASSDSTFKQEVNRDVRDRAEAAFWRGFVPQTLMSGFESSGSTVTASAEVGDPVEPQQQNQAPALTAAQQQAQDNLVAAQDTARNNNDYAPAKDGTTYCNIATAEIVSAMGSPVYDLQDNQGHAYLANQQARNLANSLVYHTVTAEDAQRLANLGRLVIAAQENPRGHGHIATVRSEAIAGDAVRAGLGPLINHIGSSVGVYHQSGAFVAGRAVNYYTWP